MYFYKQTKFATANGAVGGIICNCPSIGNKKFTVLLISAEDTVRDNLHSDFLLPWIHLAKNLVGRAFVHY